VTVDDIVATEHTSRSSCFRYFGTKEEAVVSRLDEFGAFCRDRFGELLMEDEPWFPLSRSVLSAARQYLGETQRLDLMELLWETPALRRATAQKFEEWRSAFESTMRERLGHPESDLLPGLVAYSVIGAATVATGGWARTGGQDDLIDLIDRSLAIEWRGWSGANLVLDSPSGVPQDQRGADS